jgi:hypothetical protein
MRQKIPCVRDSWRRESRWQGGIWREEVRVSRIRPSSRMWENKMMGGCHPPDRHPPEHQTYRENDNHRSTDRLQPPIGWGRHAGVLLGMYIWE